VISNYRLDIVSAKTQELHKQFKIAEFPIKMPLIFKKYYGDKIIMKQVNIQGSADVVANYDPIHDVAAIIINKHRANPNLHKRLNFSLAHELGHIVLGHYKFYASTNKVSLDYIEEEANEFAAQFLVPEKHFIIRPYDEAWLSDVFFVSTEVIKKRYEHINSRNKVKSAEQKKLDMMIDKYLFDV
jgi:Zn-dependent peptidase ImmA (M78 family)